MPAENIKIKYRQHQTDLISFLKTNPRRVLTLTYLILTFVGMSFSAVFYSLFNVDFFHYVQTGDFIPAAFKEPPVIILFVLYFALFSMILKSDFLLRRIFRGCDAIYRRLAFERIFYTPVFTVTLFVLISINVYSEYAHYEFNQVAAGKGKNITVVLRLQNKTLEIKNRLLGTTSEYIFLYNAGKVKKIIPVNSIINITIERDKKIRAV